MSEIQIVDVLDVAGFGLLPPCADGRFDHRTCDYWEDADRGSKLHRAAWLPGPTADEHPGRPGSASPFAPATATADNPFAPPSREPAANPFAPPPRAAANPFAPPSSGPAFNPFAQGDENDLDDNPFAPRRPARPTVASDGPRKLVLLGRGLGIFGSYARVLLVDGEAAGYAQFGPLSAYPRALRQRELYPQLPSAPLPAVITCIATTAAARGRGHALQLVASVCEELARRGFSAVEAYPEARAAADATSAASVAFWLRAGFAVAVDDDRYPVVRRELA